jgi:hypothetical protein
VDTNGNQVANANDQARFKLVRIKGAGMRPGAEFTLNDVVVPNRKDLTTLDAILRHVDNIPTPRQSFVAQDSTKSYILYSTLPGLEKWKIGYRHLTRQGYEEGGATKDFSTPPFATAVRNYRFDTVARRGEVDLTFTSNKEISSAILDDPQSGSCQSIRRGGDKQYRVKCFVPAGSGGRLERDYITLRLNFNDNTHKSTRARARPRASSMKNRQ